MIIAKCRKGGKPGEKIVTVPKGCDIQIGEILLMKKAPLDDFNNLFREAKK